MDLDLMIVFGGPGIWSETIDTWFLAWGTPKRRVVVDIHPGNEETPVNPGSHGVFPVAIRGARDFDVGSADLFTLRLARGWQRRCVAIHPGIRARDT